MSKPHDGRSRAPGGTTPPTQRPVGAKPAPDAANATPGARPRAAVPRERSGPIGISKGDFSTPSVRRRTTTQPRGIPIAALAAAQAKAAQTPAAEAVPAQPEPAPVVSVETPPPESKRIETPVEPEAAGAAEVVSPNGPASSLGAVDDSPFAPPASPVDLANEAAALAAEAAAVRALDPGPGTPPPELSGPPTPLPEPLAQAAMELSAAVIQPSQSAAVATPAPARAEANGRPAPDEDSILDELPTPPPLATVAIPAEPEVLAGEPIDEQLTPPPEPVLPTSNEASQVNGAGAAVTPAAVSSPEAAPADEPWETEGSVGAAAASPQPAAAPAPENVEVGAAEAELAVQALSAETTIEDAESADDSLEVVDSVDGVGTLPDDDSASASPGAPVQKALRMPTPPPIPGSFLKTPGPEVLPPSLAVAPPMPAASASTTPAPAVSPSSEDGGGHLLPGLPILPEALAQRPRRPKRSKPWFEEVFDEDYLRTLPFMRADQTLREVEFISDALRLPPAAEVLDVACGYGRHAIELVQRGVNVTGLDLSLPLLIRAADEAQRRALTVNFVHGDMREMSFERQFDGAYSMLTSFGYFDEETNLRVAERVGRALKPGARFLLDVVNRDYVVADLPVRVWWEGTGCVVLEEVDFNFHTSRILTHRSIVFEDGRQLEQEISVRAYSLHEIGRLLRQAGFRVIEVSGALATRGQFFGTASRNLLIVAEKREEDAT